MAAGPCTDRIWGRKGWEARRGPEPPNPRLLWRPALPPPSPSPSPPGRGPRPPAATAQAVGAGGARLPAVLAAEARLAGARAVHRVAAAAEALTVAFAARAERALPALAAAALLLARGRVAGALVVAAAAPPAGVAQARARLRVAARRGTAVARAGALRAPPARLAATRAAPRVARAVLALARMLTACSPAPRVARALAGHILALPMRVADTQLLAVGSPELARALYRGERREWQEAPGTLEGAHPGIGEPALTPDRVPGSDPAPLTDHAPLSRIQPRGPSAHWCRSWHRSSHGGSGTRQVARTPRSPNTWSCLRTPLRTRGDLSCPASSPHTISATPPYPHPLTPTPTAQVPRMSHSPIPHSSPCCFQPAQHMGSWELRAERGA